MTAWAFSLVFQRSCTFFLLGISYDLHRPSLRNESEIYVTLDSGEIRKLKVAVKMDIDSIQMTPINNDTIVYTTGGKDRLGRISVDWINNYLYWVELMEGNSTIQRLSLNGGEPKQIGLAQTGEITDIFPDPIYG